MKVRTISTRTRFNWLIDAAVFVSGVAASISGAYFMVMVSGGFQGGRNALYNVTLIWPRSGWSDAHTWFGAAMIAAALIHLFYHWAWISVMIKRVPALIRSGGSRMSVGAKINLITNIALGVAFSLTAITGVYFLFAPAGGFQGGTQPGWDPGFLFSRTTWDLVHTWAGAALISIALVHFLIHWGWISKVTRRFFQIPRVLPKREFALGES